MSSEPGTPTLDQLRVFLTVVETGSFAAAARKLNRATSVVSYSIANLEAQLGVSLFDREFDAETSADRFRTNGFGRRPRNIWRGRRS